MYWTLDTRPPTLDELVYQAKQRHAQRVEEIAAEEPIQQIPVPVKQAAMNASLSQREVKPGQYFEIDPARAALLQYQVKMGPLMFYPSFRGPQLGTLREAT